MHAVVIVEKFRPVFKHAVFHTVWIIPVIIAFLRGQLSSGITFRVRTVLVKQIIVYALDLQLIMYASLQ